MKPSSDMPDIERQYRDLGLVYYTPREEFINCLTHTFGAVAAVPIFVLMLLRSTTALSVLTSVVCCLLLAVQFGVSAAYHGVRNLDVKRVLRSLDYPAVSLNVMSCGAAFSLLYGRLYGYIALSLCVAIVVVVLALSLVDFPRFKPVGVVAAFVVGILMFGSFLSAYFSPSGIVNKYPVVWLHLAGLLSSLAGAAVFGVHRRYMHCVFHLFVLVGPILCTVGNLLQLT